MSWQITTSPVCYGWFIFHTSHYFRVIKSLQSSLGSYFVKLEIHRLWPEARITFSFISWRKVFPLNASFVFCFSLGFNMEWMNNAQMRWMIKLAITANNLIIAAINPHRTHCCLTYTQLGRHGTALSIVAIHILVLKHWATSTKVQGSRCLLAITMQKACLTKDKITIQNIALIMCPFYSYKNITLAENNTRK